MENVLAALLAERGEIVAGVAAALVIAGGLVLRWTGMRHPERTSVSTGNLRKVSEKVAAIDDHLSKVDQRLGRVETEISHMPTRKEFHEMDIALTRLDAKISGVETISKSTGHAVGRIEGFLLDYTKRSEK